LPFPACEHNKKDSVMTTEGPCNQAAFLKGIDEIECVTPDLNGVPRGKVMTADGFLEGRRLQMARGVLLQCIMGGYPAAKFYGSDDSDLALVADPAQIHRLPWSDEPGLWPSAMRSNSTARRRRCPAAASSRR
jgi:glutamine synthetase